MVNVGVEMQARQVVIPLEETRNKMASFSSLGGFAGLQDIVDMIVLLSSDKCETMTGEGINVSSGIAIY